jgi:hypothetical protein
VSEVDLLAFGCVVSFIAAAGAYVYVRERFTLREERARSRRREDEQRVEGGLRDVA